MAVMAHNHDWAGAPGGYQCQLCSAFVPDARLGGERNPATGDSDGTIDYVWYAVIGGA